MEDLMALMRACGYHPHLCTNCKRVYGHEGKQCPAVTDPTTAGKRDAFLTDSCSACAGPELIMQRAMEEAFSGL